MPAPAVKLAALVAVAGLYLLSTLGVLHPPRLLAVGSPHIHVAFEVML